LHASKADLEEFYAQMTEAYKRVFARLGLGDDTFVTFASGGAFTKFSHEFQTLCEAGEDELWLDREKKLAVNAELSEDEIKEAGLDVARAEKVKTAEVGNVFNFGTAKSEQMQVYFTDENGKQQPAWFASYGIGVSRLVGVLVEKFHDEKGLVWPEMVAPAQVWLVNVGEAPEVLTQTKELYNELTEQGVAVIWDDRAVRPGEKFADADLVGCPHRVVVSPKTLAEGKVELTKGAGGTELLAGSAFINRYCST
jgi:prolyl-tRNA synthetase